MRTKHSFAGTATLLGCLAAMLLLPACGRQEPVDTQGVPEITVTSPTPTKSIDAVRLTAEQQACVKAGNKLAFNFSFARAIPAISSALPSRCNMPWA